MPKNLEIKACIPSLQSALAACVRIRARRIDTLKQTDTYFNVKKGRLKLREINGRKCELIYYERTNRKGSRYSDYVVIPLEEPRAMKLVCDLLFGVKTIVKKSRILFLYRNARIHIDEVKGLGSFVEFEVLVNRGKEQAKRLMDILILEFGISRQSSIAGSYVDMLTKK
jgi:adenylate cyclase class 2